MMLLFFFRIHFHHFPVTPAFISTQRHFQDKDVISHVNESRIKGDEAVPRKQHIGRAAGWFGASLNC